MSGLVSLQKRIKEILHFGKPGEVVTICGWVRTRRDAKGCSFIEVNDGSCLANIQVVAETSLPNYSSAVLHAHTGAAVKVSGEIVSSQGKGQKIEIKISQFEIIGPCSAEEYPLQKKGHSLEYLRTIAHLRPRTNTFGAVFRVRHHAAYAVHRYFYENGFVNLHTPIISTADCEGAGQIFRVSTLDAANPPRVDGKKDGPVDFSKDFFGEEAGLTVSGQLEGELFATALGKIYTFGPTFRAENSNTPRHLAEFWMIEPEMAFCDLTGNMDIAASFVKFVISYVLSHCQEDLEFFDARYEKGIIESLKAVANADFKQLTYTEAISVLEKSSKQFEFPVSWGTDLQTEHERYLTEEYIKGPVFITNYPKSIKAFYMRLDEGEKTVAAMDLLVPRLGEIVGGSQREERTDVLKKRIVECGLSEKNYWWYLDTRRFGTVPHAGFGLGFERLIMYLTGMSNIRDVIPFPRTPGNAAF